uniref:LysM domain-containing protein n=1 Tax=Angiostrongylus cantonensis TaxID=6313 RepID=A0A0K0DGA5_ANGCA
MDYTVRGVDSLEGIAASHDCTIGELMKLNRMSSRMVFPGQKILVPLPSTDHVFDSEPKNTSSHRLVNQIGGSENAADGIRKGPGGAVPAQHQRVLMKTRSVPISRTDDADSDCLQRFLKIKVKQVTESDGTVSGTLLVTPNCLMFDPDVSHPLVKENGQDLYGMVANMDEIVSVSVYKDINALTGDEAEKKKDIFDPDHVATANISSPSQVIHVYSAFFQHSTELASEALLPSIDEESQSLKSPDDDHRTYIEIAQVHFRQHSSSSQTSSLSLRDSEGRPRSYSDIDAAQSQPSGFGSRFSPNVARRSFGKLGRTLSARAKSIQGTVAQSTKQVAHGVVSHTRSAAGLQVFSCVVLIY